MHPYTSTVLIVCLRPCAFKAPLSFHRFCQSQRVSTVTRLSFRQYINIVSLVNVGRSSVLEVIEALCVPSSNSPPAPKVSRGPRVPTCKDQSHRSQSLFEPIKGLEQHFLRDRSKMHTKERKQQRIDMRVCHGLKLHSLSKGPRSLTSAGVALQKGDASKRAGNPDPRQSWPNDRNRAHVDQGNYCSDWSREAACNSSGCLVPHCPRPR